MDKEVPVSAGERILFALVQPCPHQEQWRTKRDIRDAAQVPMSTLNRKLKHLVQVGLLEELASVNDVHGGLNPTYYRLSC